MLFCKKVINYIFSPLEINEINHGLSSDRDRKNIAYGRHYISRGRFIEKYLNGCITGGKGMDIVLQFVNWGGMGSKFELRFWIITFKCNFNKWKFIIYHSTGQKSTFWTSNIRHDNFRPSSVLRRHTRNTPPPWILKRGGPESSCWRLISLNRKN